MSIDIQKVRNDTPAVKNILHFNNAGASLPPKIVLDKVTEYLHLEAQIGGYEAEETREADINHFYDAAALLLNASPNEIAYTENATRAWDMAFYAIPFQKGDRILTCVSEYASNYIAYLQIAQQKGVTIEVIPNDPFGQIDLNKLKGMIDKQVKLISITHVPTNGGLINPAKEVGQIANSANILYLLDACQSVGQMPIDVQEIGCDMLAATGRKFLRAPRGTGLLYVKNSVLNNLTPPFLDLHSAEWVNPNQFVIRNDAKRFECWERYVAGQIGLATAIDYLNQLGIENTWNRIQSLASLLRSELKQLDSINLCDLGKHQCGIISFSIDNKDPEYVKKHLSKHNINISISSKQYTLLDMKARNLDKVLRASVHYYNDEDEIKRFVEALKQLS